MSSDNYKFSQKHNWVLLKRKVAIVGVTDYFLNELGDLIDLNLPKVSDEMIKDITYGVIENMNVLSDLISPISGEIVKVNTELSAKLKSLPKDPYGNSWFVKVRISYPEQLDELMEEEEYDEYVKKLKKKKKKMK